MINVNFLVLSLTSFFNFDNLNETPCLNSLTLKKMTRSLPFVEVLLVNSIPDYIVRRVQDIMSAWIYPIQVSIYITVGSCFLAFIMNFRLLQVSSTQIRFGNVCVCNKHQTAYWLRVRSLLIVTRNSFRLLLIAIPCMKLNHPMVAFNEELLVEILMERFHL